MHIKLNFTYDIFNRTEPSRILIAKTGKRILGELNGIQQDTCTLTINTNNTSTLDFTIDRIVDGEISNYYQYLKQYAELYVTNVGWFKINEEPELSYDGNTESSTIHAESLEIELQQYDLVGFKVNCGTEDSWEMMATDNVYTDSDGYSIPRESVKFYRDTTQFEELMTVFADTTGSLTDLNNLLYTYPDMLLSWRITLDLTTFDSAIRKAIVDMKADGDDTSVIESMIGTSWTQESARTMGSVYPYIFKYATIEVDTTNSESSSSDSTGDTENDTTTNYSLTEILDRELERQHQLSFLWLVLNEHNWKVGYIDDYVDTDTSTPLKDMVGKFEVDSQDIYSFLTQEVANYFRCIFVFNTNDYSVDAYKVENLGEDTNICLNFSNVENSITKSSDKQIYTVYHVSNNDSDNELDIREVNIGDDSIINLSYFMNIDNFTQEFIDKYNAWQETWSTKRLEYKDLSLQYRNQNDVVTELYYRVPTDMADTSQYEDFTDDELKNERTGLEAQLKGYETLYVDKDGNFDLNALKASEDWKTYKLIKNIIIPNIDIELYNRGLDNKEDYLDFDDSYEYDFDTYGDSYGVQELTIQRDTLKNNLDLLAEKGYDKEGESGDEYHAQQYELHQKYLKAYNSCVKVLEQRQAEYDTANAKLTDIQTQRQTIKTETAISNSSFGFTSAELALLDKYYFHTDYVNENIITTSLSTNEDIIDTIEQLYQDACEQLSADSQPQYNFSTTLDNLLILPEFKDWHGDLSVNNFIRVSVREDYQIKLRVISMTFNPYMIDNSLDLTFSNMVQYKSKRNDYVDLVNSAVSSAKNQITSTISSNKSDTDTFNIDANLVRKLINNNAFSGQMNNIISGYIQANNGTVNNLVAQKIDAMNINVSKITGTTAEFDELFTKYIDADYINSRVVISDIGEFKDLSAQVAMIDNLLAGNVSAEMAHIIKLTAQNVNIDEAVIRDLIAANITVSMLQASEINTDKFKIKSDDGNLEIVGNTMQFKDTNGTTRIQIGNDANDNFTFCLYDETGNGVLIDSTGIKDSAISDGLIKNNMVADGSLSKDKLNFNIVEGDADGNLDASKVIINGQGIDAEFTSIKNEIENVKSETEPTINVILSNESQNIPCTDDGLVSIEHTIDIDFICYLGLTQIPCSVVISDLPTGITVKSNTSSTASKNGTITLNVAKGSNLGGADVLNGKIVLTFSVNGNKIEKWFSWSKTKDGHQGIDGDSITITSKSITYVESDSGTITPTSGWSETIPNVANSNFLWTKTEVVYSDGNSTVSYGVSRQGSDGVSPTVTSTKTEYVQSSSGTTTPTSGWGTTPQTATAGYYMWTRTTVTYSDGKTAVSYSVSKNGTNGSNAVIYNIECSDLVIKKEIDNTLTPSTVTFSSYSKDGNSTTRNAYSGRFIIAESTDGTNFTTKYTSSANESSKKYTPSNSSITSIKCTLYASGGTTNALDSQTVHILTDADGVNEELLSVKSTISGVSSKVDNVEKSITNKVWETDIETQINNYDSSTVEVIRNKNSEMSQTIDKLSSTVSNVETTVATKADGSTIDTLFKQIATQEQSINGFKTTVSNTYATKDELNNTSSSLESSIEQSSEEFTISISKVNESLTTQKTSQENFHNTITTYFNFNDDGLNIGKTNEQYSINIDNEKMSFQQNQMEVAYIQYNKMHINAIEAVDRLSVGASSNGGYFDFISTAYGMGVKWRVEDSESVQPISTINKVARVKQVYVAIEDDSNVFFVNFGGDK